LAIIVFIATPIAYFREYCFGKMQLKNIFSKNSNFVLAFKTVLSIFAALSYE